MSFGKMFGWTLVALIALVVGLRVAWPQLGNNGPALAAVVLTAVIALIQAARGDGQRRRERTEALAKVLHWASPARRSVEAALRVEGDLNAWRMHVDDSVDLIEIRAQLGETQIHAAEAGPPESKTALRALQTFESAANKATRAINGTMDSDKEKELLREARRLMREVANDLETLAPTAVKPQRR